jgi:hypothetical protein
MKYQLTKKKQTLQDDIRFIEWSILGVFILLGLAELLK